MSEQQDIEAEARNLLYDPCLLSFVKDDLDRLIAGEDKNKLLLFCICCSSFTDRPTGCIITGASGSGKSNLMNHIIKYFPNVEEFSRMTEASPDRMAADLTNKILKIEELHGAGAAQPKLRILISEGKLRLFTTDKDERGKIITKTIETKGTPVFISTTTSFDVDEELLNRLYHMSIDESREQTRLVLKDEAREYADPFHALNRKPDQVIRKALEILYSEGVHYGVVIPFADELEQMFPVTDAKYRRDFKKFLNLIYVIAWIHQKQRVVFELKDSVRSFIIASPRDAELAVNIADDSLIQTMTGAQKRSMQAYDLFADSDMELSSEDASLKLGCSTWTARRALDSLARLGWLDKHESGRRYYYKRLKVVDRSALALCNIKNILYGETELNSYLNRYGAHSQDIRGLSKRYIIGLDPLPVCALNQSNPIIEPTPESESSICSKDEMHSVSWKLRSKKDKTEFLLKQLEAGPVQEKQVYDELARQGVGGIEAHDLIADAIRKGLIYEPEPNTLRLLDDKDKTLLGQF